MLRGKRSNLVAMDAGLWKACAKKRLSGDGIQYWIDAGAAQEVQKIPAPPDCVLPKWS